MKPIETLYKGYRFRSRLEARWAVFFDTLGVDYEYEKEGFTLSDGKRYLPDFWLPQINCWFEVKPVYENENSKVRSLANGEFPVILAMGNIGEEVIQLYCHDTNDSGGGESQWKGKLTRIDNQLKFVTDCCDHTLLDSEYNSLKFICDGLYGYEFPQEMRKAYISARSARFEFGDKPLPKKIPNVYYGRKNLSLSNKKGQEHICDDSLRGKCSICELT